MAHTITQFTAGHNIPVTLAVLADPTGGYRLEWNDGVANGWTETYPTLSLALARAAALVACEEARDGGDSRMFAHDAAEFALVAEAFLRGVTR